MKRVINRFGKNVMLALVLTAATTVASATEKTPAKNNQVEVTYLGSLNQNPVLLLSFDNPNEERATLVIKDEFDAVLYKENFSGKSYNKKVSIENPEFGDITIKISFITKSGTQTKIFSIKKNTQLIENVSMTEVK